MALVYVRAAVMMRRPMIIMTVSLAKPEKG